MEFEKDTEKEEYEVLRDLNDRFKNFNKDKQKEKDDGVR